MSKAREIAEERFAKGEISSEEYQGILKTLGENAQQKPLVEEVGNVREPAQTTTSQAPSVAESSLTGTSDGSDKTIYWVCLIPIIAVLGYRFFSGDVDTDLAGSGLVSLIIIGFTLFGVYGIFFKK